MAMCDHLVDFWNQLILEPILLLMTKHHETDLNNFELIKLATEALVVS